MNIGPRIAVMHFASEPVRGGAEEHMLMLLTHLDRVRFKPMLAGARAAVLNCCVPTCPTMSK